MLHRRSSRRLQLYDPNDLSVGVASVDLDTAPGLLVPHYDPDSRTIFLTAKVPWFPEFTGHFYVRSPAPRLTLFHLQGDNFVQAFEVLPDAPYFQVLTSFHSNSQHQAIAFLPKICCDVRAIEFAKAYRLTSSMIEPISFTVPRVKVSMAAKLLKLLSGFTSSLVSSYCKHRNLSVIKL